MARLFGTDGVRGIANKDLDPILAYKLGAAGAHMLTSAVHKPRILVARDTRISGQMLESALIAGILSVGADVAQVDVLPTPAVAFLTRYYSCDAGVMISASHNPVEYNGIKWFDSKGYKLPDSTEDAIENIIINNIKLPTPTGLDIGRILKLKNAHNDYLDYLKSTIDESLEGMKVVLDCANGAASDLASQLFEDLGATVYNYYSMPDGTNINKNCGSTYADRVQELVVEAGADVGFAFDGDADRLIAADERGVEIDGDMVLAICGNQLKQEGRLNKNTVVGTVMSNLGLDIAMREKNINLIKTAVGDRYVLESMLKHDYNLGAEKSGHVIFLDYNTTGDGMLTALQLCRVAKKQKKNFSELCTIMTNLPQVLLNVKVAPDKKHSYQEDEEIVQAIADAESILCDDGRVLVRTSGTEALVRVMIEGRDKKQIEDIAVAIADKIKEKLC